jgi:asparagine synthetase B (glutamine-hydrolysing)
MRTVWGPQYYVPDPLELATFSVTGMAPGQPDHVGRCLEDLGPGETARSVLEGLVLSALERPPCIIGFSGGRDSSALLAFATRLARREELDLPVATTFRYGPGEPEAEESRWQELVVRHIGVQDWHVIDVGNRHDIVGELAVPFLLEHGLVFPPTLYNQTLALRLARGGSHMSGEGGDEIFGARRSTVLRWVLDHPRRLFRKDYLRHVAVALGPRATRTVTLSYLHRKALGPCLTYLKGHAADEAIRRITRHLASEPFDNARSLAWHLRRKQTVMLEGALVAFSAEHDVYHLDPFLEPRFVAAYAKMVRPLGLPSRAEAMKALFGDLLPDEILSRSSKARFNRGFLTDVGREFAKSWGGGGIDTELVNPEALRAAWLSQWPPVQSFWLMQAAWLHENQPAGARRAEPPLATAPL